MAKERKHDWEGAKKRRSVEAKEQKYDGEHDPTDILQATSRLYMWLMMAVLESLGIPLKRRRGENTLEAIYKEKGAQVRLILPKPPDKSISTIYFNVTPLSTYSYGEADGNNHNNGVTVELTSTNTELTIDSLEVKHAGYYYTKIQSGNKILGGKFLVITDSPTKPNITPSSQSPIIDSSVTLGCSSSSRSKPDNHGLVLTSTWKLNGTEVSDDRFSVQGTSLVINSVRLRDKYNQYTCVTMETGQEYSGPPSEESQEFQLTPLYGPQFIKIEGAEGRSTLILGDAYGPVVCRTDCNPSCLMEWWRQGTLLISPQTTTNNQLELKDSSVPRTKKLTYTCEARVPSDAGFTAQKMTKTITVEVY
ncbi:uncharacterized protein LOC117321404, partial [Pecten maximus]|uniref:uncharacterized protein LOC117321404 n=1 Tax=Pecten maximus TaxID=6579 RepID=UPI00145805BC